mmetsp:Transcript_13044/g.20247  ORF Transcript_13044/g.20247 Transcript_13044/m.20247 type:complete len:99 (+) Transcript_13044:656-952(+)
MNLTTEDEGEDERSVSPPRKGVEGSSPSSKKKELNLSNCFSSKKNSLNPEAQPTAEDDKAEKAAPSLGDRAGPVKPTERGKRLSQCLDHLGKFFMQAL